MSEETKLLGIPLGMLLTLPGAASWSLPIGIWGWQRFGPGFVSVSTLLEMALGLTFLLFPVTAVCSTLATLRFAKGQEKIAPAMNVVLLLFNLITASLCAFLAVMAIIVSAF